MRYLHTMLRVRNLDAAMKFYRDAMGLKEVRRVDNDKGRFTLVFLCARRGRRPVQGRPAEPRRAAGRAHLQLGRGKIRRGSLLRPPRLRGRRHLRHLRSPDEGRHHHQPAAARRQHGVRPLARPAFDRAVAEGRSEAAGRALDLDAEHRPLVRSRGDRSRGCSRFELACRFRKFPHHESFPRLTTIQSRNHAC